MFCSSPTHGGSALQALTKVIGQLSSGLILYELIQRICHVVLLAVRKKGVGFLPIAMSEVLWRFILLNVSPGL